MKSAPVVLASLAGLLAIASCAPFDPRLSDPFGEIDIPRPPHHKGPHSNLPPKAAPLQLIPAIPDDSQGPQDKDTDRSWLKDPIIWGPEIIKPKDGNDAEKGDLKKLLDGPLIPVTEGINDDLEARDAPRWQPVGGTLAFGQPGTDMKWGETDSPDATTIPDPTSEFRPGGIGVYGGYGLAGTAELGYHDEDGLAGPGKKE